VYFIQKYINNNQKQVLISKLFEGLYFPNQSFALVGVSACTKVYKRCKFTPSHQQATTHSKVPPCNWYFCPQKKNRPIQGLLPVPGIPAPYLSRSSGIYIPPMIRV